MRRRKGQTDELLAAVMILCVLIIALLITLDWLSFAVSKSIEMRNTFFLAYLDKETQDIKQVFEQPALFWGGQSTAYELASHGGLSTDAIGSTTIKTPSIAAVSGTALSASYNIKADSSNVPYWTAVRDVDTETVEDTIPFLYWKDVNYNASTTPLTLTIRPSTDIKIPKEMLIEAIAIKYSSAPPTATVSCSGCTLTGTTSITKSGLYKYTISGVAASTDVKISITSTVDNSTLIRQVIVSTYSGGATIPNTLLKKNINAAKANFLASGKAVYETMNVTASVPDLEATFSESQDNFVAGMVWAPSGLSLTYSGGIGQVWSAGFVEDKLKIRYWRLYEIAKNIVEAWETNNYPQTIDTAFHSEIDNVKDSISDIQEGCGSCTYRTEKEVFDLWGDGTDSTKSDTSLLQTKIWNIVNTQVTAFGSSAVSSISKPTGITVTITPTIELPEGWTYYWKKITEDKSPAGSGGGCSCSGGCSVCGNGVAQNSWYNCKSTYTYWFGVRFGFDLKVKDATYKVWDGSKWSDLEFHVRVEDIATDQTVDKAISDTAYNPNICLACTPRYCCATCCAPLGGGCWCCSYSHCEGVSWTVNYNTYTSSYSSC